MKTKSEILSQSYLNITDIQRLLNVSWAKAKRIYSYASKIDDEELEFRVEPCKARIYSVLKATGLNLGQLAKQIRG